MKCRICGNTEANTAYEVREMMFGTQDRFGYFQCSNCFCLQIESVPENLAGYYPADYYSYIPHTETNSFRRFLLFLRNRYAVWGKGVVPGKVLYERHASTAHRSLYPLKLKRDARILDVGCGTGSFLLSLKDLKEGSARVLRHLSVRQL